MKYKFISDTVVARIDDDGISRMSCSIEDAAYLAWLAEGNTPEAADQPDPKDAIKAQIAALEAKVTPRRLREALLGGSMVFIHDVEDQIAALRAQL